MSTIAVAMTEFEMSKREVFNHCIKGIVTGKTILTDCSIWSGTTVYRNTSLADERIHVCLFRTSMSGKLRPSLNHPSHDSGNPL
jgi:hypothetical protein